MIFGREKSSLKSKTEDFSKPKIIYNDIAQRLSFAKSIDGAYLNNTAYFFSSENEEILDYLLDVLNSKLIDWYYRTLSVQLGEKAVRMFSIYVLKIPVPQYDKSRTGVSLYELYGLTQEEQTYIESVI